MPVVHLYSTINWGGRKDFGKARGSDLNHHGKSWPKKEEMPEPSFIHSFIRWFQAQLL